MKVATHSISTIFVLFAVSAAVICCSAKKNRNAPHIHKGLLKPYEAGPFRAIELTDGHEKILDNGKPIMTQISEGDGLEGTSICVQDVEAPKVRCVQVDWIGLDYPMFVSSAPYRIRVDRHKL